MYNIMYNIDYRKHNVYYIIHIIYAIYKTYIFA